MTARILALSMTAILFSSQAFAASISGIMVLATDHFGIPHTFLEREEAGLENEGDAALNEATLWRTALGGIWWGLFVWEGLPPDSLAGHPLNAPDLTVDFPLIDGENDFTIAGERPATDDAHESYVLNLYFDGVLDHPGISVVFPKSGSPNGDVPTANRSFTLSLGTEQVHNIPPFAFYDDGIVRVSVSAVSFFESDIDMVSPVTFVKSGRTDYMGVLKILVETSEGGAPIAPIGPGAEGFGVQPGGRPVGGFGQPNVPIPLPLGVGANPAVGAAQPPPAPNQVVRGDSAATPAMASGDAAAEQTPEGLTPTAGTLTPSSRTLTPSAATTSATPPTVQRTLTAIAATATPGAVKTGSTTPAKPAATPTPPASTRGG